MLIYGGAIYLSFSLMTFMFELYNKVAPVDCWLNMTKKDGFSLFMSIAY